MSTEFPTSEDFAGDESLIRELANQLFKTPPVPQPAQSNIGAVPSSVAGSGISPSAVNQGNAVDLKDPQTSLPDPHFAGTGHVPSSVAGSGASPSAAKYKGPQQSDTFYFINDKNPFHQGRRAQATNGALPAQPFDVNQVRRDFPILHQHVNGRPLVWLDNAATTQKPQSVIERIAHYYRHDNSNIHRAAHELAARSTDAYEGAREKIQKFLNAGSPGEIVFVRGAT